MSIEVRNREQIEGELGRVLEPTELVPVSSLGELSEAELGVVKILAPKQLLACLNYLRAVVPDATSKDIMEFIDKFAWAARTGR